MRKLLLIIVCVLCVVGVQAGQRYYLSNSADLPNEGGDGVKAIVGATLYKSITKWVATWTEVESTANNGQFNQFNFPDAEKDDHVDQVNNDNYYKVPVAYSYYHRTGDAWNSYESVNADDIPAGSAIGDCNSENEIQHFWDNSKDYVRVPSSYKYYLVTDKHSSFVWKKEDSYSNEWKELEGVYDTEDELDANPAQAQDKYATVGGTLYTKTGGVWQKETVAVETGFEDGILTIGTDEIRSVSQVMHDLNKNTNDINTVLFPDGSTYDKSTGILMASSADYETMKAQLEEAEFTVSKIVLGDYVTIEDGVTIFTVPNDNTTSVLGSNIDSNRLTAAEKDAIKKATDLKLVGKITKDDWAALNDKAGTLPEGHSIESLDLSDAIINDGNSSDPFVLKNGGAFKDVAEITLPNDQNYKSIPVAFAQETDIVSINIPSQVEVIGANAFHACSSLQTVSWDQNGSLKVIGGDAFSNCNVSGDIVIPASVERIEDYAFAGASHISSVTFPKGSRLSTYYGANNGIGDHAFWMNDKNDLDNVYVLEDDPEKLIACHHDAFDYDNTDGQTQMSTVKTRLHYPPSLYYYYVGEWKNRVNSGKIEGQEDLMALRNCVDNFKGSFKHKWVDDNGVQHEETITINLTEDEKQWVNGFQKFVSSGIPVTFDTQWRTYSDVVNVKVPNYADKVADVYIVCGYEASTEVNGGRVLLKQMHQGDIIPAHTGVIIRHYVTDVKNGGVLVFPHVTNAEAAEMPEGWDKPYRFVRDGDSRMTYHEDAHEFSTGISTRLYIPQGTEPTSETSIEGYENGYPNYLEFLDCKGKKRVIYNAENDNIIDWPTLEMEPKAGQKVTYRNFVFGNGEQLQHAKEEAEKGNVYDRDTNPNGYRDYTDPNGWDPNVHGKMGWGFFRCMSRYYSVNSKAFLHFPAEVFDKAKGGAATAIVNANILNAKPMGLFILDSETEVVTAIDVIPANDNAVVSEGAYYTMQGVKVNTPKERGIYIHNGKKVIVK